jgi:hypothetical protein
MLKDNRDEPEVHLLDPEIEHSHIVSNFFRLIIDTKLRLRPLSEAKKITELIYIAAFLDKWACTIPRKTFLRGVKGLTLAPYQSFALGAFVGDENMCADALSTHVTQSLIYEEAPLDLLSKLEVNVFRRLHPDYLWALAKTTAAHCAASSSPKVVRSHFLKNLRKAQSSGPPSAATPAKRKNVVDLTGDSDSSDSDSSDSDSSDSDGTESESESSHTDSSDSD